MTKDQVIEFINNLLSAIKDSNIVFFSYSKSEEKYKAITAGIDKAIVELKSIFNSEITVTDLSKKFVNISKEFASKISTANESELMTEMAYYDTVKFIISCISIFLVNNGLLPIVIPDTRSLLTVSNLTNMPVRIGTKEIKSVDTDKACSRCGREKKKVELEMGVCLNCSGLINKEN